MENVNIRLLSDDELDNYLYTTYVRSNKEVKQLVYQELTRRTNANNKPHESTTWSSFTIDRQVYQYVGIVDNTPTYELYNFDVDGLSTLSSVIDANTNTLKHTYQVHTHPTFGQSYSIVSINTLDADVTNYLTNAMTLFRSNVTSINDVTTERAILSSSNMYYNFIVLSVCDEYPQTRSNLRSLRIRAQLNNNINEQINANNFSLEHNTVREKIFNHKFINKFTKREVTFIDRIITIPLTKALHIEFDNLVNLAKWMYAQVELYNTTGFRPYQFSFTRLNGGDDNTPHYKSVGYDKLKDLLIAIYEDYDAGSFLIDEISIHYTGGTGSRHDLSTIAGYGEGVSKPYTNSEGNTTGYWLLDPAVTKSDCILNCFVSWLMYRSNVDGLSHIYTSRGISKKDGMQLKKPVSGLSDVKKHYKRIHPTTSFKRTADMLTIVEHAARVYSTSDDVSSMDPYETITTCNYIVDRSHIMLLVHEAYMTTSTVKYLKDMYAQSTHVMTIQPKTYKIAVDIINAADIESWRLPIAPGDHLQVPVMICANIYNIKYEYVGLDALDRFMTMLESLAIPVNESNKRVCEIWMHNGGRYDHHILFDTMTKYADHTLLEPIEILDLNGSFNVVNLHFKSGASVRFKDSYRLINIPLSKFKDTFQLTVGKMDDVDVRNVPLERWLQDPLLLAYCHTDVDTLIAGLVAYRQLNIDMYDMNPLQYVSASSYMKGLFYSKYYDVKSTPLVVLIEDVHKFIEKAYGGGITDMYNKGVFSNLQWYDITSLYPWCNTLLLPYGVPLWLVCDASINTQQKKFEWLTKYPGFYEVIMHTTPNVVRPYLHIHHSTGYTAGYLTEYAGLVITSVELAYMIKLSYTFTIKYGYHFKLKAFMSDMMKDLYKVKQAIDTITDPVEKLRAKGRRDINKSLLVNSYGYNGFKKYDRPMIKVFGESDVEATLSMQYNSQCEVAQYNHVNVAYGITNALVTDTTIAVAAFTTAYGRIRVHELVTDVAATNHHVMYCDTDSILTTLEIEKCEPLRNKYMGAGNGLGLGELKHEELDYKILEGCFAGLKLYGLMLRHKTTGAIKYINKIKGVNTKKDLCINGVDVTNMQDKDELIYKSILLINSGTPVTYKFNTMMMSRSRIVNDMAGIVDRDVEKTVTGKYSKGVVDEHGYVHPLYIPSNVFNTSITGMF